MSEAIVEHRLAEEASSAGDEEASYLVTTRHAPALVFVVLAASTSHALLPVGTAPCCREVPKP